MKELVTLSYRAFKQNRASQSHFLINLWRTCAARVTIVGSVCLSAYLSVCASINQHFTSGVSVRPENDITYSTGNEGQQIMWISLQLLHCRYTHRGMAILAVGHFGNRACALLALQYCVHRGFCTLVHSFHPLKKVI